MHVLESILCNLCYLRHFKIRDIKGQRFAVFAPKITFYIIHYLDNYMMSTRSKSEQFRFFLNLLQIIDSLKDIFKRVQTLFTLTCSLRVQPLLLDIKQMPCDFLRLNEKQFKRSEHTTHYRRRLRKKVNRAYYRHHYS